MSRSPQLRVFRLLAPFAPLALVCSAMVGRVSTAAAQSTERTPMSRLMALDDSVRRLLGPGSPGVAVGIVRDGRVVHSLYAGEADLSHHVPVGPSSRFNIASNAKQFTANIVLSLIQSGRLSLDQQLQALLPDALPGIGTSVTVRQLLTHTSGVRDVYDLWSLSGTTWWQSSLGNGDALTLLRQQRALNFPPGTQYLYSNSNYLLLVALVARVTDSSFADVSSDRLRAWGLTNTVFQTSGMQVIADRTRPYGGGRTWQEYPAITSLHGDGGLFTTLPDQLVWEQRVQEPTSAMRHLVAIAQAPVEGNTTGGYGYGVERGSYGGVPYLFHDGSTGAYNATFLRFPTKRLAVVVMSNNGQLGVHALAQQYADAVLWADGKRAELYPAVPPRVDAMTDVTPWLGDYRASTGAFITLARTDSGLVRRIPGSPDVRLLVDSGNVFRYATNASLKMALDRDSAGAPRFTIYLASQAPNVGTRLPPAPSGLRSTEWVGRYRNDETGAVISIDSVLNQSVAATLNGRVVKGVMPRTDHLFLNGYEIHPAVAADGRIRALLLRGDRIRDVRFERM